MQISSSLTASSLNKGMTTFETEKSNVTKSNNNDFSTTSLTYSSFSFDFQSNINDNFQKDYKEFQNFLTSVGYSGKPIAELSQDEATELVSTDGFFGVNQTADRLSGFVLAGGGDNEDKLRAGRSGIIEGFKQAEALWGEKLPQISYDTLDKALATIDKAMSDMGYSILNEMA